MWHCLFPSAFVIGMGWDGMDIDYVDFYSVCLYKQNWVSLVPVCIYMYTHVY